MPCCRMCYQEAVDWLTTHDDLNFTAPLSAITAAVVGVIVNIALFFAYHLLWTQGWSGPFSWIAAAIALVAASALLRYQTNVLLIIAGSALIGLAYTYSLH